MDTLEWVSMFFVCSGIIIALGITYDIYNRPQSMHIMNIVWILTALWGSYAALWAYYKFGRAKEQSVMKMNMTMPMKAIDGKNMPNMDMKMAESMSMHNSPHWQAVSLSALHCGAGCTLADIIGEWFTFYVPVSLNGSILLGGWILDFFLALIIGILFQFVAIREMNNIPVGVALKRAAKADILSLTAWQVGMYVWMIIVYLVFFTNNPLPKDGWSFWFMMQLAMCVGFIIAYPVNNRLIKWGIKKAM